MDMTIDCVKKSWLRRIFNVEIDGQTYQLEYYGRGGGYEHVILNGLVVAGGRSWLWYIPHFEFAIEEKLCILKVRVWPWMRLRSLSIEIDGEIVHTE
jgi:hypothetical protein